MSSVFSVPRSKLTLVLIFYIKNDKTAFEGGPTVRCNFCLDRACALGALPLFGQVKPVYYILIPMSRTFEFNSYPQEQLLDCDVPASSRGPLPELHGSFCHLCRFLQSTNGFQLHAYIAHQNRKSE